MTPNELRRPCFVLATCLALASCGEAPREESLGTTTEAIVGGQPATAYPEAVVVTSSYLLPCSGVLLAPRVVLTAGHCRSTTKTYAVVAPNANGQTATGSSDWTTFDGHAATSSDTLLIFLDAPIELTSYPVIAESEIAAGTSVVDVGRTLNGVITTSVYVSPAVTLEGPADSLGFPYNYEALPDISQDGDSGGPIELPGSSPHTVVAIVDTDTVEQNVQEATPIDLFARLDVVRASIVAQVEAHTDAGAPRRVDAGDASDARDASDATGRADANTHRPPAADGAATSRPPGRGAASGCALVTREQRRPESQVATLLVGVAALLGATRRRRRRFRVS